MRRASWGAARRLARAVVEVPSIEYSFAADCTGEALVAQGETCHGATELTFTRETGDTTIVNAEDLALVCDPGFMEEVEACADPAGILVAPCLVETTGVSADARAVTARPFAASHCQTNALVT